MFAMGQCEHSWLSSSGLISVDIQSHWTWSSTLLQSANQAFQYVSSQTMQREDPCCSASADTLCLTYVMCVYTTADMTPYMHAACNLVKQQSKQHHLP